MKKYVFIFLSICTLFIFMFNYITLSIPMHRVISGDIRNTGINFDTHYGMYFNPNVLVINVISVKSDKSAADVFRVFLKYSETLKDKNFDEIYLSSKGKIKFKLTGKYFKKIGEEFETQNPIYTIRTFPENLLRPNGSKAFEIWTGGLIGVLGKQMEDFTEFNKHWYIEDLIIDNPKT